MKRRSFLAAGGLGWSSQVARRLIAAAPEHRLPETDNHYRAVRSYVEETPIPEYHWAPQRAYEAFRDLKYGVRLHWGIYSILGRPHESWPYLNLSFAERYFSHPDWYDADFRPYVRHPLQVPSAPELTGFRGDPKNYWAGMKKSLGHDPVIVPDPTPAEVERMMARHRSQLTELLTHYGTIDMMCLDMWLGPKVWPQLRETILKLREIQPDVMLRARGIGNYGDYYTPEGFVPNSKENTDMPWFVIYPLGSSFSYERDASKHKGAQWIVHTLVDTVAKGGNFMVGVGPDGDGRFHPVAVEQLKQAGRWIKVNGEGIFGTRPREGTLWSEGENVRYTRSKDGRTIYGFLLSWPGRSVALQSIAEARDLRIQLLGDSTPLGWRRDPSQGLVIDLPEVWQDSGRRPCEYAWGLRIGVRG